MGATALVAILLFGGGGSGYQVSAVFINAGQLVSGNQVMVAGIPAGSISDIEITKDGRARVTFSVEDRYSPLPNGTRAVIRQASQSGIANRFIELRIPDNGELANGNTGRGTIDDGGEIPADDTETAVDLDQLFNTLDKRTRRSLQKFFEGSARQYAGRGDDANRGFQYFNPSLAQTSRVFNELNRDTPTLERFLLDSAKLVNALADRRDDLTNLVSNLNTTTRALGNQKIALASAIEQLPDFMRRSNTTFVNLRGALDDVDPLIEESRRVVPKLRPFFAELRPFARDARPTIRDLSRVVNRRGDGNDLGELFETFTPLARIAVDTRDRKIDFGTGDRSVGRTEGALPVTADALRDSTPIIAQGRPYTVDLMGWFDDFSNTGVYDAIGGVSRANIVFNATTPQGLLPDLGPTGIITSEVEEQLRQAYTAAAKIGQHKRCPGAAEAAAPDGSNVWSQAEQEALDCLEEDRATSPR